MNKIVVILIGITLAVTLSDTPREIVITEQDIDINIYRPITWVNNTHAFLLTFQHTVYGSKDEGQHWSKISSTHVGEALDIIQSPLNPKKIFFLSAGVGQTSFRTLDGGQQFTTVTPPDNIQIKSIEPHPTQEDWLLASSYEDSNCFNNRRCPNKVYLSQDFGQTWLLVSENILDGSISWGNAGSSSFVPNNRIFAILKPADDDKSFKGTFSLTDDNGKTFVSLVADAIGVVWRNNFLFVGAIDGNDEIVLWVAQDRSDGRGLDTSSAQSFVKARWPFSGDLPNNGYSILDDSSGAVWVGVNHQSAFSHWGNLYISDALGVRYVLSHAHVSNYYGNYDFDKVSGLDGIYISNNVTNPDNTDNSRENDLMKTFITFNNGGDWTFLQPPTVDSEGTPISCSGSCHLHLHGITSYFGAAGFGPFYSSPKAIGVIIATGNIGDHLTMRNDQVNTYMSRDAGLSWVELMKGSTIYELGDHGGIIVMANNLEATDKIYYTLDEGKTLVQYTFANSPVEVSNIVIEPSTTARKFILYGNRKADGAGVVIGLDFSGLQEAECDVNKDYEIWTPSNYLRDGCLMGRDTRYLRRKQDAKCFNTHDLDHVLDVTNCACTTEDYECDFDFELRNGLCVLCDECTQPSYDPPAFCPPGASYNVSSVPGYRLIAGDSCVGGLDRKSVSKPCPSGPTVIPGGSSSGWIIAMVVILLVVGLSLVGFLVAIRFEGCRERLPSSIIDKLPTWMYTTVRRPDRLVDDDDEFGTGIGIAIDEESYEEEDAQELGEDDINKKAQPSVMAPLRLGDSDVPALSPPPKDDFNPRE